MKAKEAVPQDPEMWYYYGKILSKKGQSKEMVEAFDKSLELGEKYKNEIEIEKNQNYGKFYNDGVAAFNNSLKIEDKEDEKAKKLYKNIISNFEKALYIKEFFF